MDRQIDSQKSKNSLIDLIVIYAFFCSMGFPGNYREFFGGAVETVIEYSSFLLQIAVMLVSSADNLMDIKLLDLKRCHLPTYLLLAEFFIQSMLVTNYVSEQFVSCLRFTVTAMFAVWVTDRYDVRRILELILAAQALFVLANLVLYVVFPRVGFYYDEEGRYLFRGVTERKNVLGQELGCGIVLQMTLLRLKMDRKERISLLLWGVLASQIFVMIVCQNVGAFFTSAVPIAYLFMLEKRLGARGRFQWGIVYAAVSIGFLVAAMTILPLLEPLFNLLGKDATLSNRTIIWDGVLQYVMEHDTFTGAGFTMFWRDAAALKALQNIFPRNSWMRTMAYGSHNVLMEMWLDMGLIGVCVYLLTIVISFVHVKRLPEAHYAVCSVLALVLLIRGLTERAYTPSNYNTMFLFLMLGLAQNGRAIGTAAMPRGAELRAARLKRGGLDAADEKGRENHENGKD